MEHKYLDRDWLYEEYIVKNRTIKSVCEEFGVSHQSVERYLKKYNIKKHPIKRVPTVEELYHLHVEQGIGVSTIAKQYPGIGIDTIRRIMSENGIEKVPASELMSKWWSNQENKEIMSAQRKRLWGREDYRAKTMGHLTDPDAIKDRAIKRSAAYQGVSIEEWAGFLTPQQTRIRASKEYIEWREIVFRRDDYTCQCCGDRSRAGHSVILHAHHLENFAHNEDLRFDVDNGITLCFNCHDIRARGSFHNLYGIHNNTREQFEEYLARRNHKDIDDEDEIGKYCMNGEIVGQKQAVLSDL